MKTTTTIAASLGAIALGLSGAAYAQTTTPAPGTTPMQTTPVPPSEPAMTPSQTPGTAPTNPTPDAQPTPDATVSATTSSDADATTPGKKKKNKKHAATPQ